MAIRRLKKPKETIIRPPRELARPRITFGKIVYIIILIILIVSGVRWLFNRTYFINAPGVMDAVKAEIATTKAMRIKDIPVDIDRQVTKGQTLVRFDPSDLRKEMVRSQHRHADKIFSLDEDISETREKLALARIQRDEMTDRVQYIRWKNKLARQLLEKGAATRDELENYPKTVTPYKSQLLQMEVKIARYQNRLNNLSKRKRQLEDELNTALSVYEEKMSDLLIRSPLDGVVTDIFHKPGEVAHVDEPIMNVADPKKLFVRAYYDESEQDVLNVDQIVQIEFENGRISRGRIKKLLPETQPLPSEYQKQMGRIDRAVVAQIAPLKSSDWIPFIRSKVQVRFRRDWKTYKWPMFNRRDAD
jgi:multidrug resistance efflux pump